MQKKGMKYIYVLGYGWSGSSAVIDMLKEINGIVVPNLEFRLIKERYGLMNLESMVTTQWDPIETDIAIKDFWWLCKKLNEKISKFYFHFGHCYSKTIGKHFLPITKEYIDKITKYKFVSTWHFFYWRINAIKRMYYRIRVKFGLNDYTESMYYTSPMSSKEFEDITKDYIDRLFIPLMSEKDDYLVLDQGVPAHFPEYAFKYSNSAKVIIVDRDPRDVYVDLVKCKELIGAELAVKDDPSMFIDWYKSLHFRKSELVESNNDILFLNFEELIQNYDKCTNKIYEYLNISKDRHVKKRQLFIPEMSKRNIGIWKQYNNQDAMDIIKKELGEYCYEY